MNYEDKLTDPRWQELRLSIIERDQRCQCCGMNHEPADESEWDEFRWHTREQCIDDIEEYEYPKGKKLTLQVHHKKYFNNLEPWEYDHKYLVTLCKDCHKRIHVQMKDEEYFSKILNEKIDEEWFESTWYSYNKCQNNDI